MSISSRDELHAKVSCIGPALHATEQFRDRGADVPPGLLGARMTTANLPRACMVGFGSLR
ncbi:MAG TPA: hypothetical protein VMZ27_17075 [Candidatus Saccharimonadales bacterium]|nr:hypothetical protein [Candidatus Saccharimonadales bacterium]